MRLLCGGGNYTLDITRLREKAGCPSPPAFPAGEPKTALPTRGNKQDY